MAAKPKQPVEESPVEVADALVLTVSEHDKLTDEEKQQFRLKGGTVTNDPS